MKMKRLFVVRGFRQLCKYLVLSLHDQPGINIQLKHPIGAAATLLVTDNRPGRFAGSPNVLGIILDELSAKICPCPNVFGPNLASACQSSPGEPLALLSGVPRGQASIFRGPRGQYLPVS